MAHDPITLASAVILRPAGAEMPAQLAVCVRDACSHAWRAIEIVLAGDMLATRLGGAAPRVRLAIEAVLGRYGVAEAPDVFSTVRAARAAGSFDAELDPAELAARCALVGDAARIAACTAAAIDSVQQLVGDDELATIVVDLARELFQRAAGRDAALAPWKFKGDRIGNYELEERLGKTKFKARKRGAAGFDREVVVKTMMPPDTLAVFAELPAAERDDVERLLARPLALDDNVQFTVYRPRAIEPGRWHPLLAFAHLAERRPGDPDATDPVEEVRRQAEAALGERAAAYQPVTQDSGAAIPAEGELVLVPELPGIDVNPPRRSFQWLEPVHREEFRIRAGAQLVGKTARGRLTVYLGAIAIAEVPLAIRVDAAVTTAPPEPTHARTYRKIFASYSHRDSAIVNQFEQYARALGDEYLRDWVHLRTGEVWTDRLRQLIDQADAFQLFWSHNSMHSTFVRQEYEHALSLHRPNFVRPTYWEDPLPRAPGLPPDTLLRLHFQKIGGAALAEETAKEAETDSRKADDDHDPFGAMNAISRVAVHPGPAAAAPRTSAFARKDLEPRKKTEERADLAPTELAPEAPPANRASRWPLALVALALLVGALLYLLAAR